ncbi:hypothetical protein HIM_10254 [Hirsutella minnesotensis 3608]|uniref:Uncharacterized protein n=1 Tax=Hirsutella minnesotensis 3608 TaxID=1043627 RepID=A0A0F7ZRX3_9HYPO|nr:hypothetical protein HIM_10254 [Hirsutella minnesotensis 3608]
MEAKIRDKKREIDKHLTVLRFLKTSDEAAALAMLSRIRQGGDINAAVRAVTQEACASDAEPDLTVKPINEVTSSGMFTLDGPPDVADVDKLRFACAAVGEGAGNGHRGPRTWVGSSTEGQRGHVDSSEPYIHVRRGDDFADAFEASFFAKTFPTLLPFGVGGPLLVEEASLESGRSPAGMEKLIALNSCYGFVTRYSIPGGQRQTMRYPRHVKGHITVFPNNVQELVTKVLPHPLVRVMDEIHVSWQGLEKPGPSDLSSLLSVRRQVVERALIWLKTNNPHYADIEIDGAEMQSWGTPSHGVPSLVYDRLERNEPSAWEKTRTAQVVPPTERAMDDEGSVEIEEILAALHQGEDSPRCETEGPGEKEACESRSESDAESDLTAKPINEVTSSGMFTLDGPPDVADVDKLRFACAAVGEGAGNGHRGPRTWVGSSTEGQRGHVDSSEPYIHVRRGDDFADAFEASFFAKTFPTLLPFGVGGPRLVEEASLESGRSPAGMFGAEAAARDLVSSRNMSLWTWANIVLRRHGGRFATHHIFRIPRVQHGRAVEEPSSDRLATARAELEGSGKTTDEGVNELLRSLSLYGYRQPMSRELRLSMRHKIQALIVRYGVPAIWFTINPNDITNPVKLRLAAYRTRDPEAAEEFLRSLDLSFKRMQLSVSDPMSSATFFHREMTLFFEHYVKDLDQEGYCVVQAERSVTSDISSLMDNPEQFSAAFDEEANFCAGATQIHTHSPTCVKYSLGKKRPKGDLCRFKAPWRLVEKTAFTPEGVLQIRRTHPMVNRWNKAMAVGLRHNHDISFIATQRKTMALVYYVTNYATKVEDPTWKRVAAAAELLPVAVTARQPAAGKDVGSGTVGDGDGDGDGVKNKTRQFLMRVANRIFTERPLSQVEVVAHLLGYPSAFTNSSAWGISRPFSDSDRSFRCTQRADSQPRMLLMPSPKGRRKHARRSAFVSRGAVDIFEA